MITTWRGRCGTAWVQATSCALLLLLLPRAQVVSNQRSLLSNACLTWFSDKVLGRERYVGFSEHEAKFYAACCVLGLEWLRERNILHRCGGSRDAGAFRRCESCASHCLVHEPSSRRRRDLKPSNLLLAENGYIKLGDLGLCKKLAEGEIAHSQVCALCAHGLCLCAAAREPAPTPRPHPSWLCRWALLATWRPR